jgi:hypothetical protein
MLSVLFTLVLSFSWIPFVLQAERTVEVEFNDEEKVEYTALDTAARDFYTSFKGQHGNTLSKHYLLLTQKLMPLRVAASGGRIPLDDEEEEKSSDTDKEVDIDSDDEESVAPKKKRAKKEKRYSEFAYTSKLKALVAELESARDEDCNGKLHTVDALLEFSSCLTYLTICSQEPSVFAVYVDAGMAPAGTSEAWLPV